MTRNIQLRSKKLSHVTLCLLIFTFIVPQTAYATDESIPAAKNFTLKSQSGKNIKLSELRGQVIMLNFWASWCGTCIQQLPILNKLHRQFEKKGFTVLAINIDESTKKAMSITKKQKLTFPVLFDTFNHVSRFYSVSSIPVSILIDRDGNIRHSLNATKVSQQKKTAQLIEELLNE